MCAHCVINITSSATRARDGCRKFLEGGSCVPTVLRPLSRRDYIIFDSDLKPFSGYH